jgi:hypothetical protein
VPPLLHVSHVIEWEAAPVYYGENTFGMSRPEALRAWIRFIWPRHLSLMRKVRPPRWSRLQAVGGDTAYKELGATRT